MNTTMFVVVALVGIGAAWLTYFRFSHETSEFLLLVGLTVLIAILLIVAIVMPTPTRTVQSASLNSTALASPIPETTSLPEATVVATDLIAPSTATAMAAPTIAATVAVPTTEVAPTSTATTTAPTATPTAVDIETTVISSAANIRSDPGPEGTIVGTARQGAQLIILAATDDWYLVRLGTVQTEGSLITTGQGWIAQTLVDTPARTVPTITPTPAP